jgi:hypothetical protein
MKNGIDADQARVIARFATPQAVNRTDATGGICSPVTTQNRNISPKCTRPMHGSG